MIAAIDTIADRVRALASGADDYRALRLRRAHHSADIAEQVIYALAVAVEAKDPFTEAHTQRVAESARRIGERMGLPEEDLGALYRGGIVHDIGKIGIPDRILLKPGALDSEERARMHLHPIIGGNIIAPLRTRVDLLPMVRHHHENYDGSGYPDGLTGERIPLLARILSVCDAYDALTNDRPYRRGRPPEAAISVLACGAGQQWDPKIVYVMIEDAYRVRHHGVAEPASPRLS